MNAVLILFTKDFPFGKGENFLEAEIPFLAKNFIYIYIISESKNDKKTRVIPDNIEIHRFNPKLTGFQKIAALGFFLNKEIRRELRWIIKNKKPSAILPCLKIELDFYFKSILLKRKTQLIIDQNNIQNVIFYSYWLDLGAMAGLLMKKEDYHLKAVSRVHGYDLYFERHRFDYLPFRKLFLSKLDAIYSISNEGVDYLSKKFPDNNLKISRLGISNNYIFNEKINPDLIIVSCSSLIPLKRVNLIIEALSLLQIPFFWFHIGSGPLNEYLNELAHKKLSKNQFEFLGQLSNKQVLKFYAENNPSIFLNTSETEGIPVSMMEAMSFGIPCIGTDVGGVSEIIENNHNGYLLSTNTGPWEIANIIVQFDQLKERQKIKLCENARLTWEKKYNASSNYSTFAKDILSL